MHCKSKVIGYIIMRISTAQSELPQGQWEHMDPSDLVRLLIQYHCTIVPSPLEI